LGSITTHRRGSPRRAARGQAHPQSLTLNLAQPKQVSELDCQPRFDGTWAPDARLKTATFAAATAEVTVK
jgi:hypothetical protein